VAHHPRRPDYYKALIPKNLHIVHATVEVHLYDDSPQ
jgi:hypothetical protein